MDTNLSRKEDVIPMSKTGLRLAYAFSVAALVSFIFCLVSSTPCIDLLSVILGISALSTLAMSFLASLFAKAVKKTIKPIQAFGSGLLITTINIPNKGTPSHLASPLAKVPV